MEFKNLPKESRVWIYQSDKRISNELKQKIVASGREFVNGWTAHGTKMSAGIEVLDEFFLVIAADEQQAMASGCSIDSSVHWVKELGATCGIDFFNRLNIVFRNASGAPELLEFNDFLAKYEMGAVDDDTIIFNTLVNNLGDLASEFQIPLSESWIAQRV